MGGGSGSEFGLALTRAVDASMLARLRGHVDVALDVTRIDPEAGAGAFSLLIADVRFPIAVGVNGLDFDFALSGDPTGLLIADFKVQAEDTTNVADAWASIGVTQCEALTQAVGASIDPLPMTAIAVHGADNGGSGGFSVERTGDLADVEVIEIVGYYPGDAAVLAGAASLYAPRWLDEDGYVALAEPVALPVFDDGYPELEGRWGWTSSNPLWSTIPEGTMLCKVQLDGAAPVLAVLPNPAGY